MPQMERFRNRVLQLTFSSPETPSPQEEISDDKLVETLKKFIDDRTELRRRIKDLTEELQESQLNNADNSETVKQLRDHIDQTLVGGSQFPVVFLCIQICIHK